jgi:anti-sigma B factor antagonist
VISKLSADGSCLVLRFDLERLDAGSAPGIRAAALELARGAPIVVVDMSRVVFVDSSGIGALVSILKLIPPGGALRLAATCASVRKVLKLTRLDSLFPAYETVAVALAA